MLSAGILNCRVHIQKNITSQNSVGEIVSAWKDIAAVWANIRYLNGKEYLAAQLEISKAAVSLRIRWRNDVEPTMRVLHRDVIYNIEAVLPDMQKHIYLDLVCSTHTNKNT